jgi:SEC-C motif domain protein
MVTRQAADSPCPCGSGRAFSVCCGPLLSGAQAAATAEALMRSRYSAFCVQNEDYLLHTWHPDTRPATVDFDADIRWLDLRIVSTAAGGLLDDEGAVEFVARYKVGGRAACVQERSRFIRVDGHWLYLAGDPEPDRTAAPAAIGRNAPCPCGSGRKYKRCCGR